MASHSRRAVSVLLGLLTASLSAGPAADAVHGAPPDMLLVNVGAVVPSTSDDIHVNTTVDLRIEGLAPGQGYRITTQEGAELVRGVADASGWSPPHDNFVVPVTGGLVIEPEGGLAIRLEVLQTSPPNLRPPARPPSGGGSPDAPREPIQMPADPILPTGTAGGTASATESGEPQTAEGGGYRWSRRLDGPHTSHLMELASLEDNDPSKRYFHARMRLFGTGYADDSPWHKKSVVFLCGSGEQRQATYLSDYDPLDRRMASGSLHSFTVSAPAAISYTYTWDQTMPGRFRYDYDTGTDGGMAFACYESKVTFKKYFQNFRGRIEWSAIGAVPEEGDAYGVFQAYHKSKDCRTCSGSAYASTGPYYAPIDW